MPVLRARAPCSVLVLRDRAPGSRARLRSVALLLRVGEAELLGDLEAPQLLAQALVL